MLTFEGRSKTVFLKLEHILEGLLLNPTLQFSDLVCVCVWGGARTCISNNLPGPGAGPGTAF